MKVRDIQKGGDAIQKDTFSQHRPYHTRYLLKRRMSDNATIGTENKNDGNRHEEGYQQDIGDRNRGKRIFGVVTWYDYNTSGNNGRQHIHHED